MAMYVYGVTRAAGRPPRGEGIGGAPLRRVAARGTAALVSELPPGEIRLGRAEMVTHTRVLEDALARGTVLPMRFGTTVERDSEVRDRLLIARNGELRAALDALDGAVEMSVRALYEEDVLMREIVRADPQIARLRALLRERPAAAGHYAQLELGELVAAAVEERRRRDSEQIVAELAAAARDVHVRRTAHERSVFTASFLIDRGAIAAFDDALEAVAAAQAGRMRFRCAGPLPPYTFARFEGSA